MLPSEWGKPTSPNSICSEIMRESKKKANENAMSEYDNQFT